MARNKHPEITVKRILDTSLQLFWEKGYDHTTIQDIVDALGDLSKGAIYHHFKGKEQIIEAVIEHLYTDTNDHIYGVANLPGLNGLERMQQVFLLSLRNPNQRVLLTAAPNLMKNPRFLALQLDSSIHELAPILQPFIEQGIADGSLTATCPKETAEVISLLSNIWINPTIFNASADDFYRRVAYLRVLLEQMGVPLITQEMQDLVDSYRTLMDDTPQPKA